MAFNSSYRYLELLFPRLSNFEDILASKLNSVGDSEALKKKYFSQLSKSQIKSLYEVYKEDFEMFQYEYPTEYFELASWSTII